MKCSYETSVAGSVDQVWASLRDADAIAAALPGATLARDGDDLAGSLKCAVGGAQITYKVTARADEVDGERHRAVVAVTGKEARGTGTLTANLLVGVHSEGQNARVSVGGDIEATGRGEGADAAAWSRVIARLVGALVEVPRSAPEPALAAAPPRPALTVAPTTGGFTPDEPTQSGPRPEVIFGLVAAVLLLLRRRRRKRRRVEGAPDDGE